MGTGTVFRDTVVVYSAMTGGYDSLKPLPDLGCEAVLFTETPAQVDGWNNIVERRPERHPRLRAKWYKMHPHVLFPDAEYSIWMDSSVLVHNANFAKEAVSLAHEALTFFPHRWRSTLRDELTATMEIPKYWGLPCAEQVASYYAEGFADQKAGLLECTVLIRRHNRPDAIAFDEAWWDENVKWTYADQFSCPYLLWKLRVSFDTLPYTLDTQPWFRIATWRNDR